MAELSDQERELAVSILKKFSDIDSLEIEPHTKEGVRRELLALELARFREGLAAATKSELSWGERWRAALERISELAEPLAGSETRQAIRELDADTPRVVETLLNELKRLREAAHA